MFSGAVFWFLMGMLFILVAKGARVWAEDLNLRMTWWKWALSVCWYGLLVFSVSLSLTFVGENESGAGLRALLFMGVITIILAAGLVRVLLIGRNKPEATNTGR